MTFFNGTCPKTVCFNQNLEKVSREIDKAIDLMLIMKQSEIRFMINIKSHVASLP
ncbi:MAG: hypothetical protein WAX85_01370 [Minisyncoccia bacterium]